MGDGGRPFVGRQTELAIVDEVFARLDDNRVAAMVEIAGEPGIGKTCLLAELQRRAAARGCLVLTGRAAEFEGDLPFGIFVDALDDYLFALGPANLATIGPEWTAELATVFSAFVGVAGDRPAALQVERYHTYRAVRLLLDVLSRSRPLVVALDDIHWADPASVELLGYLLAHPPVARAVLLMTFRPVPTPPQLVTALAAAARDGRALRLDLGPLSPTEADRLTGPHLGADVRAALYEESGGNPFYLEQLARTAAVEAGRASRLALGPGEGTVPPPVAAALATERDCLPPSARALLAAASVVGDPFDSDLAGEVAELPPNETLQLVDLLLERDLIRSTPVPRRFRFRHPIVRRAVYESTGAGWRIGAHSRAAAALAAAGTPAPAWAHHIEHSARPGDDAAVASLVEAGHAVNARAPASAAHWYGVAMRLLQPEDPRHLELSVARATALGAAGELEESHSILEAALARLPPDTGQLRLQLTAFAAGVEMLMGHPSRAARRLTKASEDLRDGDSIEAAMLDIQRSVLALYVSDWERIRRLTERALATSLRHDERALAVVAAGLRAYAATARGDDDAEELVTAATALLDSTDDETLARRIDAATYVGWASGVFQRFDEAVRHLERGIAVSRATGQGQFMMPLTLALSVELVCQGRIALAAEYADAAVEAARLGAPAGLLAWALLARSWACTHLNDLNTAIALGEEASALLRNVEPTVITSSVGQFLGLALLEAGDARRAREVVLSGIEGPKLPPFGRPLVFELLTHADLRLGNVDAAEQWAAEAEAVSTGRPLEAAMALRARAAVLLARGDAAAAAEAALRGAGSATTVGAPVEAGRARVLAGRALARAGQRDRAVIELEGAEATMTSCGAAGVAAQAAAELRRLGRRRPPGRPPGSGVEALTAREQEIAELVGRGKTNREIALACYLSEKTVEGHLSRIFAKWGISGRAALANLISRKNERRPE